MNLPARDTLASDDAHWEHHDQAPPSPSPWSEDTLKGSEQFTALLKAEQERITGKVRLAEDRARANATAALAATGVATVLRTVDTTQPTALLVILIIAILITLALSLDGSGNLTSVG